MTSKRVMADIVELQNPTYLSNRILYHADEQNINHGFACVYGPEGTPYEDCPMMYECTFGSSYPFDPPTVMFRTFDGVTRFHPNMYKEGKVCLSILHTWEGEKWASTMRMSTVLITLQSLLDTNPLRHEPSKFLPSTEQGYASFVEHSCIRYILERIDSMIRGRPQPSVFEPFQDDFRERLPGILRRLHTRLTAKVAQGEVSWSTLPYSLHGSSQYGSMLTRVTGWLSQFTDDKN